MYYNDDIDYMKYLRNKKLFIFGAGNQGAALMRRLKDKEYEIAGFIDSDEGKKGTVVEGCEVLGNLQDIKPDFPENGLIILSGWMYTAEMKQAALDMQMPYILGESIDFNDTNETYYAQEYFDWQLSISKFNAKYDKEQFAPYIKKTDSVLEFGSAEGFLLKSICAKEKLGIEINDISREYAIRGG